MRLRLAGRLKRKSRREAGFRRETRPRYFFVSAGLAASAGAVAGALAAGVSAGFAASADGVAGAGAGAGAGASTFGASWA